MRSTEFLIFPKPVILKIFSFEPCGESEKDLTCGWKVLPAISANKGCCSHQAISHYTPPKLSLRELKMETNRLHAKPSATAAIPNSAPWGDSRRGRTGYWPQRVELYIKGMISMILGNHWEGGKNHMGRFFHIPIRKALNSLSWDTWFSLINSNLLKFWLPGLCCKNCYISWPLPYLFEAVP